MATITCKHCDQEKDESLMALRSGAPSKVCLECKQSRTGLAAGEPKKKQTRRKKEAVDTLRMTVPGGGFGFTAHVTEEDALQITQVNEGADDDNVVLTRHEAKQLQTMLGLYLNRPAAEA